jgi:hypothetical protein
MILVIICTLIVCFLFRYAPHILIVLFTFPVAPFIRAWQIRKEKPTAAKWLIALNIIFFIVIGLFILLWNLT